MAACERCVPRGARMPSGCPASDGVPRTVGAAHTGVMVGRAARAIRVLELVSGQWRLAVPHCDRCEAVRAGSAETCATGRHCAVSRQSQMDYADSGRSSARDCVAIRRSNTHQYICVVGLITSSGIETRAGKLATNNTASATSSGLRMVARCSSVTGFGRTARIGVSISPG